MSVLIAETQPIRLANGRFRLASAGVCLEVDPNVGARVVSLRLGESEVLSQPHAHPDNYGSTFWDAPQATWGWPPRAGLDSAPYESTVEGDALVCQSHVDASCGLSFNKRFVALPEEQGFAIRYRIRNHRVQAQRLAPWEVTRVPGGLSFYPGGDAPNVPPSALAVQRCERGFAWYAFEREQLAVGRKHFGVARDGWLAHVTPERLLFVKQFERVGAAQCAEGHAPIEIWGQDGGVYIELENHGACVSLAPGAVLDYTVRWFVRPLPPRLELRAGNPALLREVEAALQRRRDERAN